MSSIKDFRSALNDISYAPGSVIDCTDTARLSGPFQEGQLVRVTDQGGRIERYLGGGTSNNDNWLVLKNTFNPTVQNLGPADVTINGVFLASGNTLDVGWLSPEMFYSTDPLIDFGIQSIIGYGWGYTDLNATDKSTTLFQGGGLFNLPPRWQGAVSIFTYGGGSTPTPINFWPLTSDFNDAIGSSHLTENYGYGSVIPTPLGCTFDGTDFLTASTTVVPYSNFTMTAWCSANPFPQLSILFGAWEDNVGDYFAAVVSPEGIEWINKLYGDAFEIGPAASIRPTPGGEFFVAISTDFTTNVGKIYVNGSPAFSMPLSDVRQEGTANFVIGGSPSGAGLLSGTVRYVRLFNSELNDQQIATLYNNGIPQ